MTYHQEPNAYQRWLGIETDGSPPDHYLLLGLKPYRVTRERVIDAAEQRFELLRSRSSIDDTSAYQPLVKEITTARECLCDEQHKRTYDRRIQRELFVSSMSSCRPQAVAVETRSVPRQDQRQQSDTPRDESTSSAESQASHPNYEILGEIGRGASSVVYEAYDRILHRYIAIKELDERYHMDRHESDLFWKEARFLAGIQHEHIVRIHGVDQSRRWIILELMKGDLQSKISEGPMSSDLVRSVLRQILDGLRFLHQRNVLHGEVKLGNMLIDEQGHIKLSDSPGFSLEGEFRLPTGSLLHVAPELLKPQLFGPVGSSVDLYSLGIAALELLLGGDLQRHFKGVGGEGEELSLSWMRWHSSPNEEVPTVHQLVPHAPDDLARVIDGLTRKQPSDRYVSAEQALQDLTDEPILLLDSDVSEGVSSYLDAVAHTESPVPKSVLDSEQQMKGSSSVKTKIQKVATQLRQQPVLLVGIVAAGMMMMIAGLTSTPAVDQAVDQEVATTVTEPEYTLVKIVTNPSALATIDGGEAFETPVELELTVGNYQLNIAREGYEPIAAPIQVTETPRSFQYTLDPIVSPSTIPTGSLDVGSNESKETTLDPEVPVTPPEVDQEYDRNDALTVTIDTNPAGAIVQIDQKSVGQTPLVLDLDPGQYDVALTLDRYQPQSARIVVDPKNDRFDYTLQYVPATEADDEGSVSETETQRLRDLITQGTAPLRADFCGTPLNSERKGWMVEKLTALMKTPRQPSKELSEENENLLDKMNSLSSDPRIRIASGLAKEAHGDKKGALDDYRAARDSLTAVPYFGAWRRSAVLQLREGKQKDPSEALNVCVSYVDAIVQLAQQREHDQIEKVIAYNLHYAGKLIGYIQQTNDVAARRSMVNAIEEETVIKERISRLPNRDQYLAAYELGKQDFQERFSDERSFENEYNRESKERAEGNESRITKGTIETRSTTNNHESMGIDVDHWEHHGTASGSSYDQPHHQELWSFRNQTSTTEILKVTPPEYRTSPVRSEYMSTHFSTDPRIEQRKILETFPVEYVPTIKFEGGFPDSTPKQASDENQLISRSIH